MLGVGSSSVVRSGCMLRLEELRLPTKASVHSLGILWNLGLLLGDQVAAVTRRAYYQICQTCPFLDEKYGALVTHALVTSRLNYGNGLYMGLPLKTTWKLQMMQNVAAILLMDSNKLNSIE